MFLTPGTPQLPVLLAFAITIGFPSVVAANDSAASTAVGGLQLTHEARISMQKERLTISEKRVSVEYEFYNETDADITTEVAFPIPVYQFEVDDPGGARDFDDFRVWIEGKPFPYQVEVKAMHKGAEVTAALRNAGVDISSFGHFDWEPMASRDIAKLSSQQQTELTKAGLIDGVDKFPQWSVHKTYHWSQIFPAKQILHVSHEYKPVIGFMPVSTEDLDAKVRAMRLADALQAQQRDPKSLRGWYIQAAKDIEGVCVEPELHKRIESEARAKQKPDEPGGKNEVYVEMLWVDYILTTANSWKTPIKDFELVIERPESDSQRHWYVTFCWDGPIERQGPGRFVVRMKDFSPQRELRIGFLGL